MKWTESAFSLHVSDLSLRPRVIPLIYKAKDQIRTTLKGVISKEARPGDRGVVAISGSKALNPGDRHFVYSDEVRGRLKLQEELQKIADSTEEVWKI